MNLTQMLGIVSFGTAGMLCLAMRQSPWSGIGFVNFLYCLECFFGLRHRLHDAVTAGMGAQYHERAALQIVLLGGALLLACILTAILLRLSHSQPARIAIGATTLGAALFVVEAISLHAIDRILYGPIGAALLIGWVWLGLGLAVGSAATIAKVRQAKL